MLCRDYIGVILGIMEMKMEMCSKTPHFIGVLGEEGSGHGKA